jgi:hypothetical protein
LTQSLYVIRNRDTGEWWNGFGLTEHLAQAAVHGEEINNPIETSWLPFPVDVLELRLIEKDSDSCPHCINGTCTALETGNV